MNLFSAQLAAALPADVQAVLVWDGAWIYRSGELCCPPNVTLIALPPYSPELNPVENLWHYLRSSHHWSNRTYAAVDDLFGAAQSASQARRAVNFRDRHCRF